MIRYKWSIQWRKRESDPLTWLDCTNGHKAITGYTAMQEELLLRDFQRLTEKFPGCEYRIVQHVDFKPATAASITAR